MLKQEINKLGDVIGDVLASKPKGVVGYLTYAGMASGVALSLPGFASVLLGFGLAGAFNPTGETRRKTKLTEFSAIVSTKILIYGGVALLAPGAALITLSALGAPKKDAPAESDPPRSKPKF